MLTTSLTVLMVATLAALAASTFTMSVAYAQGSALYDEIDEDHKPLVI
jgi:hypothetical protein